MFYVVNISIYLIDILQKTLKEYHLADMLSDMPVMLICIAYVIMYIISDMPVIDCRQYLLSDMPPIAYMQCLNIQA